MEIRHEPGLVHVIYPDQKSLAMAFCRFQEHYENPQFRNQIFTLGQLREWYCQHRGAWTYYDDWNGFNFPSHVLQPFKDGMFDPLSKAEMELFSALRYIPGKFYVIGTHKDDDSSDTLKHERLHALYYTNADYRREIDGYLKIIFPAKLSPLRNHLRELGYHEDVIDDEVQAYLGASTAYLEEEGIEYPGAAAKEIQRIAATHQADSQE